jgi:hypothetical protein
VLLDVSCDRDRLDIFQVAKAGALAPGQKPANGMIVRDPGVFVADRDGRELEKHPRAC